MRSVHLFLLSILALCLCLLPSYTRIPDAITIEKFPYKKAGLTDRQAAAHLLSRFTYGVTNRDIDKAEEIGLEEWFRQQLSADFEDGALEARLNELDITGLSSRQIIETFRLPDDLVNKAVQDGVITREEAQKPGKKDVQQKLLAYSKEKNFMTYRQLIDQFHSQKIFRAAYSSNQLQEVMTEFWFNHFNVSFTKLTCVPFIPSYERDVIRPNALGDFKSLLIATAKSPAMLYYLDNAISVSVSESKQPDSQTLKTKPQAKRRRGLNENYGRELLELHTLGVDGGYTQKDVTETARVFTGWGVFPTGQSKPAKEQARLLEQSTGSERKERGIFTEGDFLFNMRRHDQGEKTVLGRKFPANRGYEEGVELLTLLAEHPSTATFICRKIAIRFINDNPSEALVNELAKTFKSSGGNIREVLATMVSSEEFWKPEALRQKIKSPFELAMSAIRSLDASIQDPAPLQKWIERMGQRLYYYQPPTGFPDRAQYWISTGSLLNRMNFGLALASAKIPGVTFDLLKLNKNHEPESSQDALRTYTTILLPERSQEETISRLTPLIDDPAITTKVNKAARRADMAKYKGSDNDENTMTKNQTTDEVQSQPSKLEDYRLSQIVGIIFGSPEFQRR
jgi:uncharacterized protein (DUF1800 family)